jgi:hypothetical protein
MKKQNLIYIVGGLGILLYFFMRNKNTTSTGASKYPMGFNEGDYVKGPFAADVYVLQNGTKRAIANRWWLANFGDNYENVKVVNPISLSQITSGPVLDI